MLVYVFILFDLPDDLLYARKIHFPVYLRDRLRMGRLYPDLKLYEPRS